MGVPDEENTGDRTPVRVGSLQHIVGTRIGDSMTSPEVWFGVSQGSPVLSRVGGTCTFCTEKLAYGPLSPRPPGAMDINAPLHPPSWGHGVVRAGDMAWSGRGRELAHGP